ncbi:TetR/AcrR family transcriptional regulator [Streptomyces sp. NPDC001663]|uniref:TetR/AcrR family transcriptional regulator n=1 Tax=Streptomyces sp. NPDC001663 TaxID=3364597 RepID=UPI0036938FE5
MTLPSANPCTERADAARNRARIMEAAARLVIERGAEQVTMEAVARAAGVGKGTLFRRFGDREGLLLALLGDAEAEFQEAYSEGPPPLGPGAPAVDRLLAFGRTLLERAADDQDVGAALVRHVLGERRHRSELGRAFHSHMTALLQEGGVDGDRECLAYALLTFLEIGLWDDDLLQQRGMTATRLQTAWEDLVRRMTRPAPRQAAD